MENHKRGVAAPQEIGHPPRKKGRKENRMTVVIMRNIGGVWSFKISPLFVIITLAFFLLYVVLSLFAINRYFGQQREKDNQSEKLIYLEEDNARYKSDHQKAERRIAILEDYIADIENRLKEKGERILQQNLQPEKEANEEKGEEEIAPPPQASPNRVAEIQDLVIRKEASRMSVDFRLVNLSPNDEAIGGYVHIIALNRETEPPQQLSYPYVDLKNGMPVNYKRGQPFLIQRFKPMQARFNLTLISIPPSVIHILVYDHEGALLLNEEFEVSNET